MKIQILEHSLLYTRPGNTSSSIFADQNNYYFLGKLMNISRNILALSMLFGLVAQVQASTVAFDNMPTNNYSGNAGGASYGPDLHYIGAPATLQGMQFTSSASGYLTSVFAPLTSFMGSQPINVELSLWSDGGNMPLAKIESSYLLVNAVTPAPILELNWQGTSFLEQGINYWIVVQTDTPQAVLSWQYVPDYHSTSAVRANKTFGEDWQISFGDGGETAMRILVTPVPEPSTYAMMLAGLGLVSAVARRRKLAKV
jgi:hypothetical protein